MNESMVEQSVAEIGTNLKNAKNAKCRTRVAAKRARSAKKKAGSARKASTRAKRKKSRQGSKTDRVLALLKRPSGVTAEELMKATGWQPHSVRGFLSGTVGKRMGLAVISTKTEDGERTYAVKS